MCVLYVQRRVLALVSPPLIRVSPWRTPTDGGTPLLAYGMGWRHPHPQNRGGFSLRMGGIYDLGGVYGEHTGLGVCHKGSRHGNEARKVRDLKGAGEHKLGLRGLGTQISGEIQERSQRYLSM